MLTAFLRWMKSAPWVLPSGTSHSKPRRGLLEDDVLDPSIRVFSLGWLKEWSESSPSRELSLETLEGRILFNAAPIPAPPPPVDMVIATPVEVSAPEQEVTPNSDHPASSPFPELIDVETQQALGAVEKSVSGSQPATLIVIDPSVTHYEQLLDELLQRYTGTPDVLVLDSQRDGLSQIAERLEQLGQTETIHVLSHGDEAGFGLGSNWLSSETIAYRAQSLAEWRNWLSADADLMFYGCDLAANESGQQMLRIIADLTGADVAASQDPTGSSDLGGDWSLEFQTGRIESQRLNTDSAQVRWSGLLTTQTYQQGVNAYSATSETSISSTSPDTSVGSQTSVTVGGSTSSVGLIRFDNLFGNGPGQIPLGSTINSASLRLNVTSGTTSSTPITFHQVLADWSEASTWNSLNNGMTANGGEVSGVADAVVADSTESGMITITQLQEAVQSWSNGAINKGWAVYGDVSSSWTFSSSETGVTSQRPMLVVNYTPPVIGRPELRPTGEIRVNATTTNQQSTAANGRNSHNAVGIDALGNYVVVWTSTPGDGNGAGVYAQRYNARGVAQGAEFRVNQQTVDQQQWASVAMRNDGSFVVTWTSLNQDGSGQGIYARIFSAAGVGGTEFLVNSTTNGVQQASAIGMADDGSFVVAWEGEGAGDTAGVFARRFLANGTPASSEILVNTTTANTQYDVSVAVSRDGQFMVLWDDVLGTHGRRFGSNGVGKDAVDLLIHSDESSGNADVAAYGSGNYHIVWRTLVSGDGSGRGLWRLTLDAANTVVAAPQLVTSDTVNDQTEPAITSNDDGDFIIVWQGAGPGDTAGVFARSFLSNGTPLGTEYQLNVTDAGTQNSVSAAMLDTENYVTVWSGQGPGDSSGVFVRAYGTLKNQPSLLITTAADVSSSGSATLSNWTTGDVVAIGEPNLTLGSASTGSLSIVGGINSIFSDGDVRIVGMDVIQNNVIVGSGSNQVQLLSGDVLFSVGDPESLNGLGVQADDILVFRPSAPWNYANGSILVLFDGLLTAGGGAIGKLSDFDLVDRTTTMGDVTLNAGTLILASGADGSQSIQTFTASRAGLLSTSGTTSVLLRGDEILDSRSIAGLHFVERDIRMGETTLQAGDLLISSQNDSLFGSNLLAATRNDVVQLNVTKTSVFGPADTTASLVVDGSDLSLDTSAESIKALAIVHVGAPPSTADETYHLQEGQSFSSDDQWHLSGWSSRMKLTFQNTGGVENLDDFPVLVTLDTNRFQYSQASTNGADLRFVDSDGTQLAYEIETWNPNGQSSIWVKVPRVDAHSNSDSMWLYYGNSSASDGQSPAGVWSNGYVGVWHLNNNPAGSGIIQDSSSSGKDGIAANMDGSNRIDGPAGGALKFDGATESITISTRANDPTAVSPLALTIESWALSTGDTGTTERIVNRRNVLFAQSFESYGLATNADDRTKITNMTGTPDLIGTAGSMPEDQWKYVVGVTEGLSSKLYVDGVLSASQSNVISLGSGEDDITIGAGQIGLTPELVQFWKGGIDEVRLSNVVRSAAWTAAQYSSMTDSLLSYGQQQTVSGLLDNDSSPMSSSLVVSRIVSTDLNAVGKLTVLDDGRVYFEPDATLQSLAAGETATHTLTYAVTDTFGNSNFATATFVFHGENDAPVLNLSFQLPRLTDVIENAAPTSGDLVSGILASAGSSLIDSVDTSDLLGIAVVAVDQSHGAWQFSVDGTNWTNFANVSTTNATLLDTTARVRFIPATNYSGPGGTIRFHAWDHSVGTNGQTNVNVSSTGGSTAFSVASITASINVLPTNSAPVLATNLGMNVIEGGSVVLNRSQIEVTDVEQGPTQLTYSVTTAPVYGRLERVASPGVKITSFTQAEINAGAIRYKHFGGESPTEQFNVTVSDGELSVSATVSLTIAPVNDAPTISSIPNQSIQVGQASNPITFTVSDAETSLNALVVSASTSDAAKIPLSGLTISGTGTNRTLIITPAPSASSGVVTISLQVSDGSLVSTTSFTVTLSADPPPTANPDRYDLDEDTELDTQQAGWWDNAWAVRRKVSLNNSAQAESLSEFPVLVTLDSSNFDYAGSATNGADLRFIDRDGTVLNYEIESWNTGGVSRVWVRVPQVDAATNNDYVWMYSGNMAAAAGANSTAVWEDNYRAVYHLGGGAGNTAPITDSTGRFNGTSNGTTFATGHIGNGLDFDGVSDWVALPGNSDYFNAANAMTFSGWVNPGDLNGLQEVLSVSVGSDGVLNDSRFSVQLLNGDILVVARTNDVLAPVVMVTSTSPIVANEWQHISVVADLSANSMSIYLNGVLLQTSTGQFLDSTTPNSNSTHAAIGSQDSGSADYFYGKMDELRLQTTARSADWIAAEYDSMTGQFVSVGGANYQAGVLDNDTDPNSQTLQATLLTSPTYAQNFTFNGYGSFTYRPLDDFNGTDSFTYQVIDPFGNVSSNTVTLNVRPIDDAPQAASIPAISVNEDATNSVVDVSNYFNDVDGDSLSYSIFSNSNTGLFTSTLLNSSTGVLTLDYATNQFGQADVWVTAADSSGRSVNALLSVTVVAVNDAPVITTNTGATLSEGGILTVSSTQLTTTDVETPDGSLTYTVTTSPVNGHLERSSNPGVVINSFSQADINNGDIRYIHHGGEAARDSLVFSVSDGVLTRAGTFTLAVIPVNDAPVLTKNLITVGEGTTVIVTPSMISSSDPDNSNRTYQITGLQHGYFWNTQTSQVVTSFNKSQVQSALVTFTHDGSESSPSGMISVTDGQITTAPVAIGFNWTSQNDAPRIAINQGMVISEGGLSVISNTMLLVTDTDHVASQMQYTVTGSPVHGRLERLDAPNVIVTAFTQADIDSGMIRYIHDGGESVSDAFNFRTSDGQLDVFGTFAVSVTRVNDAPSLVVNPIIISEGQSVTLTNSHLSAIDVDGPERRFDAFDVQHGVFRNTSTNAIVTTFTQEELDSGVIAFSHDGSEQAPSARVNLTDGLLTTSAQSVMFTFTNLNSAPTLASASITVAENTAPGTVVGQFVAQDQDADDRHVYQMIGGTGAGVFAVDANTGEIRVASGSVLDYESTSQYDVMVRVTDQGGLFADSTMTINLSDVNEAPTLASASITVAENTAPGTVVGQFVAQDQDADDRHVYQMIGGTGAGVFAVDANTGEIRVASGSVLDYESTSQYDIMVRVTDQGGLFADATMTINLSDVNEAPRVIGFSTLLSSEDALQAKIDLHTGWFDPDGNRLEFDLISNSAPSMFATVSIDADGMLHVTGAPDAFGTASLIIQATDSNGLSSSTTFSLMISSVNDAPAVSDDQLALSSSTSSLVITPAILMQNDTDVDHDQLQMIITKLPSAGQLTLDSDGNYYYQTSGVFTGKDVFEYVVTDGQLQSSTAIVTISGPAIGPAMNMTVPGNQVTQNLPGERVEDYNSQREESSSNQDSESLATLGKFTSPNRIQSSTQSPHYSMTGSTTTSDDSDDEKGLYQLFHTSSDESAIIPHHRHVQSGDAESRALVRTRDNVASARGVWTRSLSASGLDVSSALPLGTSVSTHVALFRSVLATSANQTAFEEIEESIHGGYLDQVTLKAPTIAGASLSVGYVIWTLRGGVLITSLLAQMPAWRLVDPLVVLDSLDRIEQDDESIGSLVEQGQTGPDTSELATDVDSDTARNLT